VVGLLSLVLGTFLPGRAAAAEDEWTVGLAGVVATIPTRDDAGIGFGAAAHVRYGLTESLSLAAGALYSHHLAVDDPDADDPGTSDPIDLVMPRFGITYAIDVLEIIPYLAADVTMYIANDAFFGEDSDINLGPGLRIGFGLDYRPWRSWSLGGEVGYHAFLTDIEDYPAYIHFDFHASWHSDPF